MQRCKNMLEHEGTTEGPADMPFFPWDAEATHPPYLRTSDPHVHCFEVRTEKDIRRGPYLATSAQHQFPFQAPATKELMYPKKPEWWPQVEVSYGFSALLPLLIDHVGSVMLSPNSDHLVFAMSAILWLLGVMSTCVACVKVRKMIWHLPPRLIQGLEQPTPQQVAEGCSASQLNLIKEMLKQHRLIEWESVKHKLRRPSTVLKDQGAFR